jgi:HSP20 family protein
MFELVPWSRTEKDLFDLLRGDFEDIFDPVFGYWPRLRLSETVCPCLDLSETDEDLIVKAEIPGVDPKDVHVTLKDGRLSINGEKKEEKEEKKEHYRRVERRFGSFSRNVRLPYEVVEDKIKADYRDGILTIKLPKSEKVKEKQIKISVN